MTSRQPTGRSRSGAKPGATREQVERRERFERARRDSLRSDADGPVVMYGWHTVTAALQNPARHIRKLLATENAARRMSDEGISPRVAPEVVRPSAIAERLLPDAVHQGLYLETDPLPSPAIEELPAEGVVLVLDQITDPHNVGAIFRSAAAFGATAIVTTQRHSPEATGALAKAASGAFEYVPLLNVQNLARGLAALKQSGFLVVGLDSTGEADLADLAVARSARIGAGRRRQGFTPVDQGNLRSPCPHRSAGRDQKSERVQRGRTRTLCREPTIKRHVGAESGCCCLPTSNKFSECRFLAFPCSQLATPTEAAPALEHVECQFDHRVARDLRKEDR